MCFAYFCQLERHVKFLKDAKFSIYKIFIQKLPTQLYCYIEQKEYKNCLDMFQIPLLKPFGPSEDNNSISFN